jgi:FMN-dependent NADH-azoreductase
MRVLRVDSSAQIETSQSRRLVDRIVTGLNSQERTHDVVVRDLDDPLLQLDRSWITANTTPENERTAEQQEKLVLSDRLVNEIEAADLLIIGVPVYNFSIPASLKLWIDQICRAGRTFTYEDGKPKGLLVEKRAIVCFVSGGTLFGSDIDFASGYMRHILSFIGIADVDFVTAECHYSNESVLIRADAEADKMVRQLNGDQMAASYRAGQIDQFYPPVLPV